MKFVLEIDLDKDKRVLPVVKALSAHLFEMVAWYESADFDDEAYGGFDTDIYASDYATTRRRVIGSWRLEQTDSGQEAQGDAGRPEPGEPSAKPG